MTVLNVAIIGSDELSREIAKHSDSRDVDTYVHKEAHEGGYRIISLISPVKFPERLRPLPSALNAARAGIIVWKGRFEPPIVFGCDGSSTNPLPRL